MFLCCWPSTSLTPIRPGVFPFRREELEFLEILSSTRLFQVGWHARDLTISLSLLITKKFCCRRQGSNLRSSDQEPDALPTELLWLVESYGNLRQPNSFYCRHDNSLWAFWEFSVRKLYGCKTSEMGCFIFQIIIRNQKTSFKQFQKKITEIFPKVTY